MNPIIAKLLEYQEVDAKLYKLESDLKNSKATKDVFAHQKRREAARDELARINRTSEELFIYIDKYCSEIDSLMKDVEEVEQNLTDITDINEADFYLKKIDIMLKSAEKMENEVTTLKHSLEEARKQADNELKQFKISTKIMADGKAAFDELKKKLSEEAKVYIARLNELKKAGLNETLLANYNRVRAKKMPVLVPLNGTSCGGCGMDIPADLQVKVKKEGFCECPNCGRIIYVED